MNQNNIILLGLFIVQAVLGVYFYWQEQDQYRQPKQNLFVGLEIEKANKITIESGEKESVTLNKKNDKWLIDDKVKANSGKIDNLLVKISDVRPSWPISSNEDSYERFEVADNKFQKKITLTIKEDKSTFYIGTSPGYRQSHIRLSDKEEVYAANINNFDFPVEKDDWLDRNSIRVSGKINQLAGKDYSIKLVDKDWQLSTSGTDTINQETAKKIVTMLDALQVIGIADIDTIKEIDSELNIQTENNKKITLKLGKKDDNYFISKDQEKIVYHISQSTFEDLITNPVNKK